MGDILRMIVVLSALCGLSGFALSYLKMVTAPGIEEQVLTYVQGPAIHRVFTGLDNNPIAEKKMQEVDGVQYAVYPATKGGEYIGAAVEASAMGFGGELKVLVGFDAEGNVLNYSLLSHAETPGLGSKADVWFKDGGKGDITGMNPGQAPLAVSKDGGQVDAITASTITSRAFLNAVNAAYAAFAGQELADGATGATQKNVEQPAGDGEDAPAPAAQ